MMLVSGYTVHERCGGWGCYLCGGDGAVRAPGPATDDGDGFRATDAGVAQAQREEQQ